MIRAALCFLLLVKASTLWADVRLEDGTGFAVEGRMLSFDGEFYRIETEDGVLALSGQGMTCLGDECPHAPRVEVTLSASDAGTRRLILGMLRGFARDEGLLVSEIFGMAGIELLTLDAGETGGEIVFSFVEQRGDWQVLRAAEDGPGTDREVALAFDGLAPSVSPENPVTEMTLLGVRAALAGEFANWSGLGGDALPVRVIWTPAVEGSLTRQFQLDPAEAAIGIASVRAASRAVAIDPGALSLLPVSDMGGGIPLVVAGVCGRGTLGFGDAIRTGDYPLSEMVLLRYPGTRQPPVLRQFLRWLSSTSSYPDVRRAGFLDLGVGTVALAFDGRQEAGPVNLSFDGTQPPPKSMDVLGGARRLNVAMRFQDGSSLPDRFARFQIGRLADAVRTGAFEGQTLIFVGFSDADGAAAANLQLSERRAQSIRNQVVADLDGVGGVAAFEAIGLGEAMPVACNGVDWGERLNRRVEVWVGDPKG